MTDIFAEVKEANRIEDVIREAGYELRGSGRYLRAREHDSLVVDAKNQSFHWNSRGEQGDVINWVMLWKRTDTKGAVEFLARRAGLEEPTWTNDPEKKRLWLGQRAKEDAFTVAARVFVKWLRGDADAMAYAQGRGWTEETIKKAGLGFSGRGTEVEKTELRDAFLGAGIELDSPAAVAVLGYVGDVMKLANKHQLDVPTEWISAKEIKALPRGGLVYPHVYGGRVRYLSLRAIPGVADRWFEERRAHNLTVALAGNRQVYFNHAYAPGEKRCVVVEGQADAISLGQWDIPAVALVGTAASDQVRVLEQIRERHDELYIGVDGDEAGESAVHPLGEILGPMARLVRWTGKGVKDANDWLGRLVGDGMIDPYEQATLASSLLEMSRTYVEKLALDVGGLRGAPREDGIRKLFEVIRKLDEIEIASLRGKLTTNLGINLREFNAILKASKNGQKDERRGKESEIEIVEIVGGYIGEWLLELTYDPETQTTGFAYRDPEGNVGEVGHIDIDGKRYMPVEPDTVITREAVVLPSKLGPKREISELVEEVDQFIHKYYDVEKFFGRLAAFYVVFTWVYDSFRKVSYLRALGDWGSGKTEFIWRIGHLCYRMMKMTGAASTSAMFRLIDQYRGTLYMDEIDWKASDTDDDRIKILNTGNSKGNPVWRVADMGGSNFKAEAFDVFGPKLLSMRKPFQDQATESRCITLNVRKRTTNELIKKGIPLEVGEAFFQEARDIRNKLLTWRMYHWQPIIEIDNADIDTRIEPRLNQITMPLKRLVDDPEMKKQIEEFIREYNNKLVLERSLTLEAKALQAVIMVRDGEPVVDGNDIYWDLSMKNIAKVMNEIMDEENRLDDDEEEEQRKKKQFRVTSRKAGQLLRSLGLETDRKTNGPLKGQFCLEWDEDAELRISSLRESYGV